MRFIIFLFITCSFSSLVSAQKTNGKKTKSPQLAIDNLYNKYKNKDSTTIYFAGGSLVGKIEIDYNEEEKPSSITIKGSTRFLSDISKFISSFSKQKIANGFKDDDNDFIDGRTSKSSIEYELDHNKKEITITLSKGNEYTTIYCYKSPEKHDYAPQGSYEELDNKLNAKYNFYITTGDLRREAGSKGQKFDF